MDVWIGREGERHGPYREEDVRQWLRTGQLSRDDLGWYDGLADWQPLAVLFADELSAPPGQAQPPAMPPPVAPAAASVPPASQLEPSYASFGQRLAAWIIDYLILSVIGALIAVPMHAYDTVHQMMQAMQDGSSSAEALAQYSAALRPFSLVLIVLGYVYYLGFEASRWQATPGKLALKLRVTDQDGRRASVGRVAARNVVRLLNLVTSLIPFICYIAVAWTQRRQGLHDLLAKTLVLQGRAGEEPVASRDDAPPRPDSGSFSA